MFTQFLLVSTEQPMQARAVCMYMYVRSVCFITMWHFLIKALQTYNTMLVSDLLQFMPSAFIFALKCQGYPFLLIITPHACTRGKAIGFVRLSVCLSASTKIARSGDLGVIARYGKVENVPSLVFSELEKDHERYKSRVSIGHAFRPHLVMPYAMCYLNCACSNSS